jgi:hypothetical protein
MPLPARTSDVIDLAQYRAQRARAAAPAVDPTQAMAFPVMWVWMPMLPTMPLAWPTQPAG